jgi:hypothetical protein
MGVDFDRAKVVQAANADGEFQIGAHLWNARVRLDIGEQAWLLEIHDGAVGEFAPRADDGIGPCTYRIEAPRADWEEFLKPMPPHFLQDLNAALWRHNFHFEGDALAYYPYYRALNRIFELIRQL